MDCLSQRVGGPCHRGVLLQDGHPQALFGFLCHIHHVRLMGQDSEQGLPALP